MYAFGDKCLFPSLKDSASTRFESAITTDSGTELANSVTEAYTSTPGNDRVLRDIVLAILQWRLDDIIQDKEFSEVAKGDSKLWVRAAAEGVGCIAVRAFC
jgi:hypothetical protein